MKYIITESQLKNLRIRRNIPTELRKYITSSFEWLNPKAFNNFDEFLERVIFSSSRDFTSEYMGDVQDVEDYYSLWEFLKPIVKDIVMNEYYDEILHYYNSNLK